MALNSSETPTSCDRRKYPHVLIEGDNRVVMASLIERKFQFQLIYMDPPYNTGRLRGARKEYRDNIKAEWSDDIEQVAKMVSPLLAESGFLAVSINQMELFNLKPIIDKVLGADSFIGIFPVKIRHKERQLMINATFHDVFEYLLIYRKNKKTRFYTTSKTAREDKFIYAVETLGAPSQVLELNGKQVEVYTKENYRINQIGFTPDSMRRYIIAGKLATANWSGEWYESHLRKLGQNLLIKVHGLEKEGLGYRWFETGNERRDSGVYYQSQLNSGRPILPTNDLDYTEVVPTIYKEGGPGCDFKDSKKPEALLQFLMSICTLPGDLVFDPFGGSGTTIATAIKQGRIGFTAENNPMAINVIENRLRNLADGKDNGAPYAFEVRRDLSSMPSDYEGARNDFKDFKVASEPESGSGMQPTPQQPIQDPEEFALSSE
jgi:adenine-specific DNA-methyltransferase